jgi:hypothetical protein
MNITVIRLTVPPVVRCNHRRSISSPHLYTRFFDFFLEVLETRCPTRFLFFLNEHNSHKVDSSCNYAVQSPTLAQLSTALHELLRFFLKALEPRRSLRFLFFKMNIAVIRLAIPPVVRCNHRHSFRSPQLCTSCLDFFLKAFEPRMSPKILISFKWNITVISLAVPPVARCNHRHSLSSLQLCTSCLDFFLKALEPRRSPRFLFLLNEQNGHRVDTWTSCAVQSPTFNQFFSVLGIRVS